MEMNFRTLFSGLVFCCENIIIFSLTLCTHISHALIEYLAGGIILYKCSFFCLFVFLITLLKMI